MARSRAVSSTMRPVSPGAPGGTPENRMPGPAGGWKAWPMDPVANGGDPAESGGCLRDVYDDWHGARDDVRPVVEFLARRAAQAGGGALVVGGVQGGQAVPAPGRAPVS